MYRMIALGICVLLQLAAAQAQTPEEISKTYLQYFKAQDWDKAATLYDPEALKDFREMMSFMNEMPPQASMQFMAQFFGPGATIDSVADLSDEQYFASFMQGVMGQVAMLGQLDFQSMDVLGSIPEGDDLRHVVVRTKIAIGEMTAEEMEVVTFKETEDGWKIQLQGKIKGMAQQMKATMAAMQAMDAQTPDMPIPESMDDMPAEVELAPAQ